MTILILLLFLFEWFGIIAFVLAFKVFHLFLVEGKWNNLFAMLAFLILSLAFGCGFMAILKELNCHCLLF